MRRPVRAAAAALIALALAAPPLTAGRAQGAEAVFRGAVTCSYNPGTDFSSIVTATVAGGRIRLAAADPLWSMGSDKDFARREVDGFVAFEQSPRFGRPDFYFAGAIAHIRVLADADTLLTIKPAGGITVCRGALPLVSGTLAQGLTR